MGGNYFELHKMIDQSGKTSSDVTISLNEPRKSWQTRFHAVRHTIAHAVMLGKHVMPVAHDASFP